MLKAMFTFPNSFASESKVSQQANNITRKWKRVSLFLK